MLIFFANRHIRTLAPSLRITVYLLRGEEKTRVTEQLFIYISRTHKCAVHTTLLFGNVTHVMRVKLHTSHNNEHYADNNEHYAKRTQLKTTN